EYSKDGFVSDTNTITTSTTDDGSYDWTIPNDPSSTVTVRISDASDASINDVSDADITILSGLSIDENTIESMRIYPNPTKGMIYIETVDTEKIISVKLYDLLGKVIMVSETNNTVDLKYLPSGIYFIKIKTQNNHIVRRIIKD
ncbi:T9SS C-terminal target domain-containing protein, partial [Flavobacteriaceae bacterium PRS1]